MGSHVTISNLCIGLQGHVLVDAARIHASNKNIACAIFLQYCCHILVNIVCIDNLFCEVMKM